MALGPASLGFFIRNHQIELEKVSRGQESQGEDLPSDSAAAPVGSGEFLTPRGPQNTWFPILPGNDLPDPLGLAAGSLARASQAGLPRVLSAPTSQSYSSLLQTGHVQVFACVSNVTLRSKPPWCNPFPVVSCCKKDELLLDLGKSHCWREGNAHGVSEFSRDHVKRKDTCFSSAQRCRSQITLKS